MLDYRSMLLCFAAATTPLAVNLGGNETELPDLNSENVMVLVDALQSPQHMDAGTFGQLPENVTLPVFTKHTIQEEAMVLARQTRNGGKNGFSALIHALRFSGIEVTAPSVALSPVEERKQGIALSLTSIQMMSNGAATPSAIPLSDYLVGASAILTHTEPSQIGLAILDSLQKMMASRNPGLRFFAFYIDALGTQPGVPSLLLAPGKETDLSKLLVSPLQMSLLGVRLAAETAVRAAPGVRPLAYGLGFATAECMQKAGELVKEADSVRSDSAFSETLTLTARDSADHPEHFQKQADAIANFLRLHAGSLKAFDFNLSLAAREPLPLVRTKTTQMGGMKTLFLEFVPS